MVQYRRNFVAGGTYFFTVTLADRRSSALVEHVVVSTALALPVSRGRQAGEVRVYAGKRLVASAPLVTATAVSAPDTSGKVAWYAGRTLQHLAGLVS